MLLQNYILTVSYRFNWNKTNLKCSFTPKPNGLLRLWIRTPDPLENSNYYICIEKFQKLGPDPLSWIMFWLCCWRLCKNKINDAHLSLYVKLYLWYSEGVLLQCLLFIFTLTVIFVVKDKWNSFYITYSINKNSCLNSIFTQAFLSM